MEAIVFGSAGTHAEHLVPRRAGSIRRARVCASRSEAYRGGARTARRPSFCTWLQHAASDGSHSDATRFSRCTATERSRAHTLT